MASKAKGIRGKREAMLPSRISSKNFVVVYGFIERNLGVFFGISGKTANAVVRNKIKRFFRDSARKELGLLIKEGVNGKKLSICLISKKSLNIKKNEAVFSDLKNEIQKLVENIAEKTR